MSSGRPPPPLFPPLPLDPISDNLPSDIISRDSSSSDSDTETTAKRGRMLKHAESYLRGEPLYLHSAGLRGPVVKNPWAKGKKQTKRKAMELEEGTWEEDMSKRLRRRQEEREVETGPSQVGRNATNMWSRGTNTTWDRSGPSTPTPLRTRPPEATNVPDRSQSHSPPDKDLLEFRTPVKKKPKAPIEVASAFSPGTFYRYRPKPQQSSIEDSSNHQRSSNAKKSSPPLESACSASGPISVRKTRKEPLEVRDSTPRLRPRKNSLEENTPDMPTQVRDTAPRHRSGRKPTTEPILEAPIRTQDLASRPRSTRSSTRASEPELEPSQESRSTSKQTNAWTRTKSIESSQEARSIAKHRFTRNSSKILEARSLNQEQEQILDTIEVVPPHKVQSGDIDVKKTRLDDDFGAVLPFGMAPERPRAKRRQRGMGSKKKGKRPADTQTEEQEISGNMDIKEFTEPKMLQQVEDADAITYVPGPEDGPEMVEIMNKEIDPGLADTRVAAVTEPNNPCGHVEVTSEEPSITLAIPEPGQGQVAEEVTNEEPSITLAIPEPGQGQVAEAKASLPSKDPTREEVFQNWVNRHVAASQKFSADHKRISIANLLSPVAESPVVCRNTNRRVESIAPDSSMNGGKVAVSRHDPITTRPVEPPAKLPALLPPISRLEKAQSPILSRTVAADVPCFPDPLPKLASKDTHKASPTQFFRTTHPAPGTQIVDQHESWQNIQQDVLVPERGFVEAIQESPAPLRGYPLTAITPGRDLLRPIRFFDDEAQSEAPINTNHFVDSYKTGGKSPFKTPAMENVQWTVEPDELLKTPGSEGLVKSHDERNKEETLPKISNLQWTDQSYEVEGGTIPKTPGLESVQWSVEPGPREREESPPKTPPSRQLSPFKISFGSEESETTFTPFHAFATPESSPKANRQRESSPHGLSTFSIPSTCKKSIRFGPSLSVTDGNDESGENDNIMSFSNSFSAVLGVEPQGTESLLEQVKDFMGEGVWDAVAEAQKIAGSDTTSTAPMEKGEKKEYISARKRRALLKKKP
ncbi:hypothetical protein DFP73DRAFT_527572 [Morchella snyderi]|nr:hypothetical protein DFP73DRAFT_527572 [Morchella snyderi]